MTKKVLLVHGWGGSDFPHWQSWLAGELAKDYGEVSFLRFSEVDFPKLDAWKQELREKLGTFQPEIVICHSLANTLWFHLCEEEMTCVMNLYLVAPPSLQCKVPELAEFFPVQVPTNLFAKNTLLISSTNDPYMSEKEASDLQEKLQVQMKVIENGGHLNTDSGYGEWPWMLKEVRSKL